MGAKYYRREKLACSQKRRGKTATPRVIGGFRAEEQPRINNLTLPARNPKMKVVSIWLEDADSEMEAARTLFEKGSPRLHRSILESLHDAVEKNMKAVIVYKGVQAPRGREGHDLVYLENLLKEKGVEIPVEHKDALRNLILVYPRTRYEEAGPLPSEFQDRAFLERLINKVEELNQWLKAKSG